MINNPGTFLVAIEASPNDKIYKTTNDGPNLDSIHLTKDRCPILEFQ